MKYRFFLICLVLVFGISLYLFYSFYEEAKNEAISNAHKVQLVHARQAAQDIEDFFNDWTRVLKALSVSEHIAVMDKTGKENIALLYQANKDKVRSITRADATGRIIYAYPIVPGAIGSDISQQKHIEEILRTRKPVISDVFKSVQGYDTIAYHVPVIRNGAFYGTIAVTINFHALSKRSLEEIKIGETGYAWMITRDGTELYCPVPGHTGKSVFENCRDFPSVLAMVEDMLRGNQGTAVYTFDKVRGESVETVRKHAVYMPVKVGDTFWSIAIAASENEIVSSVAGFRNRLIGVVIFLFLGGILLTYYGIKAMVIVAEAEKRKSAEDALIKSESKLAGIIEFLPDATFVVDLNGKVIAWNRAMEEMTGISKKEILGKGEYMYTVPFYGEVRKHLLDLIDVSDRELESQYHNVQRKGNILHAEAYAPALYNGRGAYIFAACAPLFDQQGDRIGAVESIRDITERKQAEEDKEALEVRLQRMEKMEALGTLAGGVAHDLNNVLGIVIGYAELLLFNTDKASPLRSHLQNILEGGERAAAIVQDLLTLARRGVANREILNLNSIVTGLEKTPEFVKLKAHHPSNLIRIELEPGLLNISGSSLHISKTLYNLVLNSCEAMPDGGELVIRTSNQCMDRPVRGYDEICEGDYVVLSVKDTGEGIAEADLKHIFEPFYTKKVMGKSGTGLGLAVVWGTVRDHKGYIDVISAMGKGSEFRLYFPATREATAVEQKTVSMAAYMGRGEIILVVDDVKGQRDLTAEMLGLLNYNVVGAASGEEACEFLKTHGVDLVVLDMIMDPGMDGLDTYKKIIEIHPRQKAVIVSGFSESERVTEAQRLGAGAYLRKPYVMERLGMVVRRELDRQV